MFLYKNIRTIRVIDKLQMMQQVSPLLHMFVKNEILPSCVNCVHFIECNPNKSGRCKLFYKKNILTGRIEYEYASFLQIDAYEYTSVCRKDNNKCGKYGRYFIPLKI